MCLPANFYIRTAARSLAMGCGFVVCTLLGVSVLCAQDGGTTEVDTDPEEEFDLRTEYENSRNYSLLQELSTGGDLPQVQVLQVGDFNEATLLLTSTGSGDASAAAAAQLGNGNEAQLELQGDATTFALTQRGDDNLYSGELQAADGASVEVLQEGSGNVLLQDATLDAGATQEYFQLDDNNQLDASDYSGPVRVVQTGGASATLTEIVPNGGR